MRRDTTKVNEEQLTLAMDALVLAGGESRRMGAAKASLRLGNSTLVGAVVAVLRPLFRRTLIVTRDPEGLDGLGVDVVLDDRPERGPLVGLARGLAASEAPWCFAVGCDMPLIRPGVVCRMADRLETCDILVPYLQGRFQPLHAFYGQGCLPVARELLNRGVTALHALLAECTVRTITAEDLLDLDPDLRSFRDVDTIEDYEAARRLVEGSR